MTSDMMNKKARKCEQTARLRSLYLGLIALCGVAQASTSTHAANTILTFPANTHYVQAPRQPVTAVSGVSIMVSPAPHTAQTSVAAQPTPAAPATPLPASASPVSATTQTTQVGAPELQMVQMGVQHVVQPKETLYSLSQRYKVSQQHIMTANNLSSTELAVGQVLVIFTEAAHTVSKGDNLTAIARLYRVSRADLMQHNQLTEGAILEIGQVLRIPPPSSTQPAPLAQAPQEPSSSPAASVTPIAQAQAPVVVEQPALPAATLSRAPASAPSAAEVLGFGAQVRQNALTYLNIPYRFGAQNRNSTDCSGLTLQVFASFGIQLPRRSADQARVGKPVALRDLQAGDLLFFDTAGGGAITHVGIYIGDDQFVNANSHQKRVTIDKLMGSTYWKKTYRHARRVLPEYFAGR